MFTEDYLRNRLAGCVLPASCRQMGDSGSADKMPAAHNTPFLLEDFFGSLLAFHKQWWWHFPLSIQHNRLRGGGVVHGGFDCLFDWAPKGQ